MPHSHSPFPIPSPTAAPAFEVICDRGVEGSGARLTLNLPVLAGPAVERFPPHGGDGLRFAFDVEPVSDDGIEPATAALYERLLRRAQGRHLCRIWNYLPDINRSTGQPPIEVYRAFSRARSRAFEAAWGPDFEQRLPAASAVGGEKQRMVVVYAESDVAPLPIENPEQLPAYEYPPEHGPRSPSFSRATRLSTSASEWLFVSGTAAIKGHRSIAPGELHPQIACTLDNLALIGAASGIGRELGMDHGWRRHFKVYLRNAGDFAAARTVLEDNLFRPGDQVTWLQADICRADLVIEIEATLSRNVP